MSTYIDFVNFLEDYNRYDVLRSRQNIHWPTFVSGFSAIYRVSIPGGYPHRSILLFQAS